MSTITMINYDSCEIEDQQHCEKMNSRERVVMPVHRSRSAIRGSRRTPSSRSTSRRVSKIKGGMHRRRQRMA
jgi:hypothetical protein